MSYPLNSITIMEFFDLVITGIETKDILLYRKRMGVLAVINISM